MSFSDLEEESGRDGGDTLAASRQSQTVSRRRRERNRCAERGAEDLFGLLSSSRDLGALADRLHRYVADAPASSAYALGSLAEEVDAGSVGPLGLAAAEVAADVAKPGSAENCVDDGVCHAVSVGVTFESGFLVWPLKAGQPQGASGYELVNVGANADPRRCHRLIMPYAKRVAEVRAMMDR